MNQTLLTTITLFSFLLIQSCSDNNSDFLGPVDHFIHSLNKADYDSIERDFSPQMKDLWNNGTLSEQVKKVRRISGNNWSLDLSDKQEYETEKGQLKHFNYTVDGIENTLYTLSISTIEENSKETIVNVVLIDSPVFSRKLPITISPNQRLKQEQGTL